MNTLVNFENHERKFDIHKNNNHRKNHSDNNRNNDWKNKNKVENMCIYHGYNHEWKYYCLSTISKKIKKDSARNDDYSECSSDETMHMMYNEDDTDA